MLKRHSQIIVLHVEDLVAGTNLDDLIPQVVFYNVFTQDMVNRILVGAGGIVSDQSRALYMQVPKRGPQAFSGLVNALLNSGHDSLGRMLLQADGGDNAMFPPYPRDSPDSSHSGHMCWYSHNPTPTKIPAYMEAQFREMLPLNEQHPENFLVSFQEIKPWAPVDLIHATEEKTPHAGSVMEYYHMMSKPRGFGLIINNINFEHLPVRNGAQNDELALKDLLEKLYFEVESHRNKTKNEMVDIVEKFAAKGEWSSVDCCWVVLMSHGQEGHSEEDTEILGTDSVGFKTRDVLSYFYNDNCAKLRNKPKIFIFQSCRGLLKDPGIKTNLYGETDPYSYHHRTETDGKPQEYFTYVRSRADMFVAYPVPPGMKANRDKFTGAWFIQNIVQEFARHCHMYDLEDLLKIVDRKIRKMINPQDPNHQTVSTRTIGWNKKLFFNPGLFYQNGQLMREIIETEGVDVVDNNRNGKTHDKALLTRADDDDSDNESKQLCFTCHP